MLLRSMALRSNAHPRKAQRFQTVHQLKKPKHQTTRKNFTVYALRNLPGPSAESDEVLYGPYTGTFGKWFLRAGDVHEVRQYRLALSICAAAFIAAGISALLGNTAISSGMLYVFAAAVGTAASLIHIYITPIKRAIQSFSAAGSAGMLYVSIREAGILQLVQHIVHNPSDMWFIGPLFAALEGIVIKEGLCYGKLEASVLAVLTPAACVAHLAHAPAGVTLAFITPMAGALAVFALNKWSQPVTDDYGDKSVFCLQSLSEDERNEWLARLEQCASADDLPVIDT